MKLNLNTPADLPGISLLFIPDPIVKQKGQNLQIQFENKGNGRVQVSFRSIEGDEWVSDHLAGFIDKHYDLASLKDGEYDLEFSSGQQLIKKKVLILTDYKMTRQVIF